MQVGICPGGGAVKHRKCGWSLWAAPHLSPPALLPTLGMGEGIHPRDPDKAVLPPLASHHCPQGQPLGAWPVP